MAIKEILKYIAAEFNHSFGPSAEKFVYLGNIARIEEGGSGMSGEQDKVILTLVNIEEEVTLKNNSHYVRQDRETVLKREPTIFLNLYILLSSAAEEYETALSYISHLIGFYQRKRVFTATSSTNGFPSQYVEKIILELVSLKIEDINHLWGVLGSKYHPSVLFKLRLVPIQTSSASEVDLVETVNATGRVKKGPDDDGSDNT